MVIVILAIFIICGLIVADAIFDYVFLAVYAVLLLAALNNLTTLIKNYKKHKEMDFGCIGYMLLWLSLAIFITIIKNTLI